MNNEGSMNMLDINGITAASYMIGIDSNKVKIICHIREKMIFWEPHR